MSPIPELRFEGVVLAAGRSLRMRTDKANLAWADGERLWQRQWRILGEAGIARRWLSVRSDQAWVPADVAVVRDAVPDAGPLAGMLAAGAAGDGTHVVVLAVDLPEVSAEWVRGLMTRAKPGAGVVGRWADGTYEPLAALYPRGWLEEWRAAFGGAAHPPGLQALLRTRAGAGSVAIIPLGAEHKGWFRNANTPDDLRLSTKLPPGESSPD
jgi:molybdopterin-guanine dinucleotide biosynthesis protein A